MANNILDRIVTNLATQLKVETGSINADTTLESLGIDSFDFIEFLFLIEDEFDIKIDANYNDLGTKLKTIGDVAAIVEAIVNKKGAAPEATPGSAVTA